MLQFPLPNYTQVPNNLIDSLLPQLKETELKVLLVIMRKTLGWHKIRDRISLAQMETHTGCLRQAILKATKSLEKAGLISKKVEGEKGSQQTYYELVFMEDSNNSYQCEIPPTPSRNNTHTKETLTKENLSPIIPKGDRPFSQKRAKEEKKEVAPGVFLTSTQMQDIQRRVKGDDSMAVACYEKLSCWKIGKGRAKLNDYMNITRWVIKAVEEDQSKPKPQDQAEMHKKIAEMLMEKHKGRSDIVLGYNYIELGRGMTTAHLKFGEAGFREQLENQLRKMQLSL